MPDVGIKSANKGIDKKIDTTMYSKALHKKAKNLRL